VGIRLMVVTDQVIVRAGVLGLTQGTEIEVVSQTKSQEQMVKLVLVCQPDVVLLDLRLAGSDGLCALERVHRENPDIAILIFSESEEFKVMARARSLGAMGCIPMGGPREELLKSIRRVAGGKNAWTPQQIRKVVSRSAATAVNMGDKKSLSAREYEVLKKIVDGLSNEMISEELEITIETVKQHVKHVLKKLHVVSRTQAALFALHSNLFALPKWSGMWPRGSESQCVWNTAFTTADLETLAMCVS